MKALGELLQHLIIMRMTWKGIMTSHAAQYLPL